MRLNFNVLWVEDQPGLVVAQEQAIARQMAEHGFHFAPTYCRSLAEVQSRIAEQVFSDEVDLILVDWDLGTGVRGQEVIGEIRHVLHFKDVIFYSAMASAGTLREIVAAARVEGTYCVTRTELVSEVVNVFESLIKKVLDLDHARGIVMGATSDIDFMVQESLSCLDRILDNEGRAKLAKKLKKQISDRAKTFNASVLRVEKTLTIATALEEHALVTAYDRLRLLAFALGSTGRREHKSQAASVKSYMEEVVPHRNRLGHLVLQPDGRPVAVEDNQGEQITLDETRKLRCRLLELRSDFQDLAASLRADASRRK